ncbi:MAG TPA: hypothetical protein VF089_18960, partial [Candidatus Binatia bacterium]
TAWRCTGQLAPRCVRLSVCYETVRVRLDPGIAEFQVAAHGRRRGFVFAQVGPDDFTFFVAQIFHQREP